MNWSRLLRCTCLALLQQLACASRPPVILLPGLAGSVLEAKLNRTADEVPAIYCSRQEEWHVIWLSAQEAIRAKCFLDELAIRYDPDTKRYSNASGVDIRPYDFGGLGGVDSIDPGVPGTGIYSTLLDNLKNAGWAEGQDLFGAPYDFRLAADGLTQVGFFSNLTALIEQAVQKSGGRPAMLVAHSMGCLVSLYFLSHMNADWLHKNVAGLVAFSAPWEGSVTALKGSISGDNFDITGVPASLLHPIQSTAASGPWLFPTPDVWGDKVLVRTTGSRNYTGSEVQSLLDDLGLKQQSAMYHVSRNLTYPMPMLDLPVWCLYGVGVDTDEGYVYDVDVFNASVVPPAPKQRFKGDGDGTVNLVSLQACKKLGEQAIEKTFKGAEHTGIISNDAALQALLDILHSRASTFSWLSHKLRRLYSSLPALRRLPRT